MLNTNFSLPTYHGYALGNIIAEDELHLPLLQHDQDLLFAEIERLQNQKIDTSSTKNQALINRQGLEIQRLETRLADITTKIKAIYERQPTFTIHEALPLDERSVRLVSDHRSFKSNRLEHISFSKADSILPRLQAFVTGLFRQDATLQMLPPGTLEAMGTNIHNTIKDSRVSVTVMGAFIELDRPRRLEPFVIRPNTRLRPELLANANKYFVLSEAVLGAVFLGIGKEINISDSPSPSSDSKNTFANLSLISFTSQGAILKMDRNIQNVNLWSTYVDWVEAIQSDPNSGYPIRYKVRSLVSVLEENDMLPIKNDPVK